MKTKSTILMDQCWAMTGDRNSTKDLRRDFYLTQDLCGLIDAPEMTPTGSTVENVIDWSFLKGRENKRTERCVIGDTARREQ